MKVLSVRKTVVWYVVLDLPFKEFAPKLKKVRDVRLYEVSWSGDRLGMLVAGQSQVDAQDVAQDILRSYGLLK